MPSSHSAFHWQEVDQKLANNMLQDLAVQLQKLSQEDLQQFHYLNIGRGNQGAQLSQRLRIHLLRTDEWAARTYEIYCEVWRCQRRRLSPEFLRGICHYGIQILIPARTNTVIHEVHLEQERTHQYDTEFTKAVAASFKRDMDFLLGKWQRFAELDAASVEYLLSTSASDSAISKAAREIIHARARERYFDARLTMAEMKLKLSEKALDSAELRNGDAFRIKTIGQMVQKHKDERQEFLTQRQEWQSKLSAVLNDSADVQNADGRDQRTVAAVSDIVPAQTIETELQPSVESKGKARPRRKARYKSPLKRAISLLLVESLDASDLEVCRGLDEDGAVELPASWTSAGNRRFELAYKSPKHKRKVEIMISKVRSDMRKKGLLPDR